MKPALAIAAALVLLSGSSAFAEPDGGVCTPDSADSTGALASDLGAVFEAPTCGPVALSARSTKSHVDVIVGDDEALARALTMIGSATSTVQIETFLLNGPAGNAIADALIAKRKQGLEVQVLLDPNALQTAGMVAGILNPNGINTAVLERLRAGGIDVRSYDVQTMPSSAFTVRAEHAKLLVVDGRAALMGGTNFDRDVNHDLDLALEGPAVDDLVANFNEGWSAAGGRVARDPYAGASSCDGRAARPGEVAPNARVRVLSTGPGARTSKSEILRAIDGATTRVSLEMYGLTDSDVVASLQAAKARGVDVKVILFDDVDSLFFAPLSGNYDNSGAMMELANKVTEAVPVKLYENILGGQMHTKMLIVDGKTSYLGSTNYTHQEFSGVHNYVVEVTGGPAIAKLTDAFEDDWKNHATDTKVNLWVERRRQQDREHENGGGGGG